MRRIIVLLLALALLATSGCGKQEDATAFYYLRIDFVSGDAQGVIAPEYRELSETQDMNYLLRLYLEGPVSEQYTSPFPRGVRLVNARQEEAILFITLSEEFSQLTHIDLTLACGCLAQTCFTLTDAQEIQIITAPAEENQTIILTRESFTLLETISDAASVD